MVVLVSLASTLRFEDFWVKEPDCFNIIQEAWSSACSGSPVMRFCKKLKITKRALKKWNKERVGNIQSNIRRLMLELEKVQMEASTDSNFLVEENLRRALGEEHRKEESLWRSKSRVQWLTSPDLNTRFFYMSTIVRRRRNALEFIKNPDGQWLESRAQAGQLFVNSFSDLFSTTNPEIPFDLEGLISSSITTEENVELFRIPLGRRSLGCCSAN